MYDAFEAQARQAAFRRRHRPGQKVRARMLRAEGPDLAWVAMEGQELLARVSPLPPPGAPLLFLIVSLEPEIRLQDVTPAFVPASPLGSLAADFTSARHRYDALARAIPDLARGAGNAPAALIRVLRAEPDLARALLTCAQSAATLSRAMEPGRRLLWQPWLPLGAERHETVLRRTEGGLLALETGFFQPGRGQARIRLFLKPPRASYRILLDNPAAWPEPPQPPFPGLNLDLESFGAERLPPGSGGVLADALAGR